MKALDACGTWIHYQHTVSRIIHNAQDMAVPANENIRPVALYKLAGMEIIVSWVASYVGHKYGLPLTAEEAVQRIIEHQPPLVAIADDAHKWPERRDIGGSLISPSEVPGMPYFTARLQKLPECRVKTPVGIGYESDFHHAIP